MAIKLMLGVFLLAAATVTPSLSLFDGGFRFNEGPICRFVNSTTGKVINSTGCPFSDMDDPPYVCVNSSDRGWNNWGMNQGRRGSRNRRDADGGYNWDSFFDYFRPSPPAVREDRCELREPTMKLCNTDSDCPSVPGLMVSRCRSTRWGRRKQCSADISSVAKAMFCAQPCEISQGGEVIFRDLTQCRGEGSLWDHFGMNDEEATPRVCENSPSMTIRVDSKTYEVKTCVPGQQVNNNGGNNGDNNGGNNGDNNGGNNGDNNGDNNGGNNGGNNGDNNGDP